MHRLYLRIYLAVLASLAAFALACPVLRLEAKFRNDGLITGDFDMVGFCVERIRQLLD